MNTDAETLAAILAERIAWMRAYVRCETCRWWGKVGGIPERKYCTARGWYRFTEYTRVDEGCAGHWEPKEST